MPHRSTQLLEKLSVEEDMQLGVVVRAVHNLCRQMDAPATIVSVFTTLIEQLVRTALSRAKPNRRMAYLEQWRQFLCWLPDALGRLPLERRVHLGLKAIENFRLTDWRGKRKSKGILQGANVLLEKGGELWYAQLPDSALVPPPPPTEPPAEEEYRLFLTGELMGQELKIESPVDISQAKFLRPFNQPRVLRNEYDRIYPRLKEYANLGDSTVWHTEFPDVPKVVIKRWFEGRDPTHSDLALLVAAHRAALAPSHRNLSRLREMLAWSK